MHALLTVLQLLSPFFGQEDPAKQVRELVEKLRSESIEEREDATKKLKELGRAALPELEKAAGNGEAEVRIRVGRLLRAIPIAEKLTHDLKRMKPGVEDRLASPDDHAWTEVLLEAWDGLGSKLSGDDLDFLSATALHAATSVEERRRLCEIAGERGCRPAIPELILYLKDRNPTTCQNAIRALVKLHARSAWPDLVRLLNHSEEFTRGIAADALRDLQAHEAIPEVTKLLRARDPEARKNAVTLLGHLQKTVVLLDPGMISEVALLLTDGNPEVRASAVETLGDLGAAGTAGKIVVLLKDTTSHVRGQACLALAELGAREAAPEVFLLLKDPDPRVRSRASLCLGMLKAKEMGRDLVLMLKDEEAEVRKGAAEGLGFMGFRDAIPDVTALAKDPEFWVRSRAVEALGRLKARESIKEIGAALRDEDLQVRLKAVEALGRLASKECVPGLMECIKDGKAGVQEEAIEVLGQLEVREAMPVLATLLEDPKVGVRVEAASWLCHFGSKEGVPVLLKESRSLIFLNALRRPEQWRKLRAGPPVEEVVGTGKEMLDRTAKQAGIALDWSPESLGGPRRWIVGRRRPRDSEDRTTLLQVLINYTHSHMESVLEGDRISVLTSREALSFWMEWWKTENGK